MGDRIAAARKRSPRVDYVPSVPEAVADSCEKTFEAADENSEKSSRAKFDDNGVFAIVCRHDIPIAMANIDTAGEQQKYMVSLIEYVMELLPSTATVVFLYDIGCVVDRSLRKFHILPESMTARMAWNISVLHPFGHEWPCQILKNPRMQVGMGLTDGEGTERFWSRCRKLIPITRHSSRNKRIYLLDGRADTIQRSIFMSLGTWIRNRVSNASDQASNAASEIAQTGLDQVFLQRQWDQQRQAQAPLTTSAPARLRKHLENVLRLQDAIGELEAMIDTAQKDARSDENPQRTGQVESLRSAYAQMVHEAEALYASLNVSQAFPELQGATFEYVHTLLAARELKINIRQRAIGRFFEVSKLDQAVGGKGAALGKYLVRWNMILMANVKLGTKLHQKTLGSIQKRGPALARAISRFNGLCDDLERLAQPEWNIPVPQKLSVKVDELKDDPNLYEDVCVSRTPAATRPPPWLINSDVRQGIRANVRLRRCREEQTRLYRECDNLIKWYHRRRRVLEATLASPEGQPYRTLIQRRLRDHTLLQHRWSNPYIPHQRWGPKPGELMPSRSHHSEPTFAATVDEDSGVEDGEAAILGTLEELTLGAASALNDSGSDADDSPEVSPALGGPNPPLRSFTVEWVHNLNNHLYDYLEGVCWSRSIPGSTGRPLGLRRFPSQKGFPLQLLSPPSALSLISYNGKLTDEAINIGGAVLKLNCLDLHQEKAPLL